MKELLELLARMRSARQAWLDHKLPDHPAARDVFEAAMKESDRLERVYMDAMCEFAALTATLLDNGSLTIASAPARLRPYVEDVGRARRAVR